MNKEGKVEILSSDNLPVPKKVELGPNFTKIAIVLAVCVCVGYVAYQVCFNCARENIVQQFTASENPPVNTSDAAALSFVKEKEAEIPKEVKKGKGVKQKFIERFAEVAVGERKKFGIPASITLAQALLESDAGRSELSRTANNFFGIKHSKNDKSTAEVVFGCSTRFKDDCGYYAKYESAWESIRAHSELLVKKERYQGLFRYQVTDYKSWAVGLKKAGYAEDPQYAQKLINIIKYYNLSQYDKV